jgi:hypothetical protein
VNSGKPFEIGGVRLHVGSSEDSGAQFETLGFLVTPKSQLPGLSNRLVCFVPDDPRGASFIELLSIVDRTRASPAALDLLDAGRGPIAVILSTEDAFGLASQLGDERIEPRHINRKWILASQVLNVEVTTLNVPRIVSPLGWTMMQHYTPQHYRIPEFVAHPNSVTRFRGAIAVAPEPEKVAERFRGIWGGEVTGNSGRAKLRIGTATLEIYTSRCLQETSGITVAVSAPKLVGARLEVSDQDVLMRWMKPKGLITLEGARGALLPPSQACGCLLTFETPGEALGDYS